MYIIYERVNGLISPFQHRMFYLIHFNFCYYSCCRFFSLPSYEVLANVRCYAARVSPNSGKVARTAFYQDPKIEEARLMKDGAMVELMIMWQIYRLNSIIIIMEVTPIWGH